MQTVAVEPIDQRDVGVAEFGTFVFQILSIEEVPGEAEHMVIQIQVSKSLPQSTESILISVRMDWTDPILSKFGGRDEILAHKEGVAKAILEQIVAYENDQDDQLGWEDDGTLSTAEEAGVEDVGPEVCFYLGDEPFLIWEEWGESGFRQLTEEA